MKTTLTEKRKKVYIIILMTVFVIYGLFCFCEGIFKKTITINPAETQINVHLYEKSIWPPFKNIDIFIQNVKQAKITTHHYRTGTCYDVELEYSNGKSRTVKYSSYAFDFAQTLCNKINNAIENRTDLTITFRETTNLVFGIIFIVIGISFLFYEYLKSKRKKRIICTEPNIQP
jgi:hypothetical protein